MRTRNGRHCADRLKVLAWPSSEAAAPDYTSSLIARSRTGYRSLPVDMTKQDACPGDSPSAKEWLPKPLARGKKEERSRALSEGNADSLPQSRCLDPSPVNRDGLSL